MRGGGGGGLGGWGRGGVWLMSTVLQVYQAEG